MSSAVAHPRPPKRSSAALGSASGRERAGSQGGKWSMPTDTICRVDLEVLFGGACDS